MPCDLIYGIPNGKATVHNYDGYCTYIEMLRNSMVDAYFKARECLGDSAVRQKIYYDRDTSPHSFKNGDLVSY